MEINFFIKLKVLQRYIDAINGCNVQTSYYEFFNETIYILF